MFYSQDIRGDCWTGSKYEVRSFTCSSPSKKPLQKPDCFHVFVYRVYDIASGKQLRSFKGAMGDDGIILKVKTFGHV